MCVYVGVCMYAYINFDFKKQHKDRQTDYILF